MHVKRFLRIISVPLWSLHKCIHLKNIFTWDLLDWRNRPIWLEGTTRDYRCFHKYEDVSSTEVWTKLIPLIRMTEMYYIIAETATDETEALDALNTVLFNRGVKELEG